MKYVPIKNAVIIVRDKMGLTVEDKGNAELYPNLVQPFESPGRLALVKTATRDPRLGEKMMLQQRTGEEQL